MVTTQPLTSSRSFSYGFKPKQNIPESQKNEDWANENIDWCISMSPLFWKQKTDDYYALHNGDRTSRQFEHITKTYGIEFPAGKLKHIPLIRPHVTRILSEAEERIFEFSAHSEDTESTEDKITQVSTQLLKDIYKIIKSEGDPHKALEKVQRYYQEEYRSEMEIGVQHFITQYISKHRLDRQFSDAMLDKIISGKELYRVKVNRVGEDPEYSILKAGTLFWADNNKKWINECDWGVHVELCTPTEILDRWGERMKDDDVKKVESWLDMYHKDAMYKLSSAADADKLLTSALDTTQTFNNASINHKLAVYHTEWKSIRRLDYLKNDNKYAEDAPFIKILSNEQLRELPGTRKKRAERGYIQDLWGGIRIADDIFVDQGRVKYPVRSMSSPSKVYLTFNGLTHNGKIKPYSLYGETQDIQDLYDVLHWHKENLIALSGVKGSVMDLGQIPNFSGGTNPVDNIKMFLYYKKLGTAFIDRSKEGLSSASAQFNQFPTYDDTIGAGLDAILKTIEHLEEVAGRITGINRQALGQTQQYDGKATNQMAQQNSSMVIEYLFNEHDEFVERSLTDLANAARVSYKNGVVGHYTDNQRMQQIFRLDGANFPYADWGIHITNRHSDAKSIQELKGMSSAMVREGLMQIEDILPLFRQTGLAEITRQIQVSVVRRREQLEEMQQQMAQMEQQLKVAKEQAEIGKLNAQIEEISGKMATSQQELALEQAALSGKENTDTKKLELEQKRVDLEAKQLEVYAKQNTVKSAEIKNK